MSASNSLTPLLYQCFDSYTFTELASRRGIDVTCLEDLTDKVPHVGYGGAYKSTCHSQHFDRQVWVLERIGWYAGDGFANDVWMFDRDFTTAEAAEVIELFDRQRQLEREQATSFQSGNEPCSKCGTWCYGDCEANHAG